MLPRFSHYLQWSGKTNRLIEAVDRASEHFLAVEVIKHAIDTRHLTAVVTRSGLSLPATQIVADLACVQSQSDTLYAVDEAQFFGAGLLPFASSVLQQERSALVLSGLDLDFARKPFGAVLQLAQQALQPNGPLSGVELAVHRLAARCSFNTATVGFSRFAQSNGTSLTGSCGRPALYSQRLHAGGSATVLVGGGEYYQPACELHHSSTPVFKHDWGGSGV